IVVSTWRPDYSASRPSLRLHGPPFLEQPTLRLALSAPSLAASFGRVSIAEVALFQRNSTQAFRVAWTSKTSKHFLFKMSLLFKRHYTSHCARTAHGTPPLEIMTDTGAYTD